MKPLVIALSAMIAAACATQGASSDPSDDPATSTAEAQANESLEISPKACFIEGFCPPDRVVNHPSYCIHTQPCAQGEALDLAQAYCRNHCGGGCDAIVQLADCP